MTTPTPQDYALKPCPFCAGAEIFIEPDERGSGGQWVGPVHVGCKACGCQLCADDESKAVAWWNRRAPQPGWLPISEAPTDTEILVGPTKRMGICVAMNDSRDGWVTETPSEWVSIYPPTVFQFLPPPPSTKGESTNG